MRCLIVVLVTLSIPLLAEEGISSVGPSGTLRITSACAGYQLDLSTDSSGLYTVECQTKKVVKGALVGELPPHVKLRVKLEPIPESTSTGFVELTTTPQVLLTNVVAPEPCTQKLICELSATVEAEVTGVENAKVVLTLE